MRALPLAMALLSLGCGKGPPHFLEGSLSAVMALGYATVVAQPSTDALAVRFVLPRGEAGEDTVLEVAVDLHGTAFTPGVALDLAELSPAGQQRGSLSRNVLDDPRRTFPPLQRGTLLLDRALEPEARVSGELRATFENGVLAASGHTVFGTFQAGVP